MKKTRTSLQELFFGSKTIFFLFYFFLIVVYGPTLATYVLSGDDLVSLTYSIRSFHQFVVQFTTLSGGYRPLSYFIFGLYSMLAPHSAPIFLINLGLIAISQVLLFIFLKKIIPSLVAFILVCALYLSPIYYYHIFTVSGTANILILISGLSLLQLIQIGTIKKSTKNVLLGFFIFIVSLFIKETFIMNGFLFLIIVYQNVKRKIFYQSAAGIIGMLILYALIRTTNYVVSDINYSFVYTPAKLFENISLIGSWLLQFPRGWQYGAPLPKNIVTYIISGFFGLVIFATFSILFVKKRRVFFVLTFLSGLSLAPYFFLNRVLVYYVDVLMILFIIAFSLAISLTTKGKQMIITLIMAALFIMHFLMIHKQWHTYSFVANANETAKNYIKTLKIAHAEKYDTICILNHNKGGWATENGNLANFIYGNKFKIISIPDSTDPKKCDKNSLILINDERNYKAH